MSLKYLLTAEHVNSRFVYLMTSSTVCLCVLVLVGAFIFTHEKTYYPEMIGILLTGGVGGAAGRWLTTKKGPADPVPDVESQEITTVKKSIKTK